MTNDTATTMRVTTRYVDWGSIFAGALAATALSSVLLTAGAAIGLSLVSPYPSQSYGKSATTVATAWALVVTIGSFLTGGYIAGRMRSAWGETNSDEVQFRDGIHGFLVWSLSIFMGSALAFVVGSAGNIAGAQSGRSNHASERGFVLAPAVDVLLRGESTPGSSGAVNADLRDEVARILVAAVSSGKLSVEDRSYLAQVVTRRSGVAAVDAERRVAAAYADAGHAIDLARTTVVLIGLVTATALLIGLAAAWYAAQRGGHHRDNNIPAKFGFVRKQTA
jgi:hypothetical protein